MPPAKELTAMEVKRLTKPGFYNVGGVTGLYLNVAKGGSRAWILRATVGDKRRDIGLGGFPDVLLAAARGKAREYKEMIRQGIDPVNHKKELLNALKNSQAKEIIFIEASKRCHVSRSTQFRSSKHQKDWISALERHAFPKIGKMIVSDIELPHILQVLEPIWHTKTETATRVRQRMEAVLSWATVSQYRAGLNPARWDGNLSEVLPQPSKIREVKHFAALPWQKIGEFMRDIRQRNGIAAKALEFAILTASRSGEVRGMTWDEVDPDKKLWTIPEGRIKAGKKHSVPLSSDALKILTNLPRFEGSPYVFPAVRGGMLSDVALLAVMKRMGVAAVPHGFRSTFKDWARNNSAFPDEVSELALAHVNSDSTRAAYARDELLPQRTRLMNAWAKFCNQNGINSGDVVPIRKVKHE